MTERNPYVIIIVGAGPAGISTALHLQQQDPELASRTLMLEKAHHPRHKLCGGGVLPDGEVILESLGLDITEIPHRDVDWAHFDYNGKGFTFRANKGGSYAFRTIRRSDFDAWLVQKVAERGIEIREGITVKAVKAGENDVMVETDQGEYSAKVVVGADGSRSLIRKSVGRGESAHMARLLEVVTDPKPERSFHIQADSYFDFFVVPKGISGYVWDFPALDGSKQVRVRGIYDSNVRRIKPGISLQTALSEEFHRHGLELGDYKLEGHPLHWFDASSTFATRRILLVGDAAGADALYGEGISFALGYGALAARAIREAFASDDFSFKGYKAAILKSEMGKALRWRTWLARFFSYLRPGCIQALLWRRLGAVVEWIVREFAIGWAERERRFDNHTK